MSLSFVEILKIVLLGIIEGITEWLPISSTGHLLLFDAFFPLNASNEFKEMFFIIIQLGAILAVFVMFWKKMMPIQFKDKTQPRINKDIVSVWIKANVACIPGSIVTLLFDDFIESHLHLPWIIAAALIVYGIVFIIVENRNKHREPKIETLKDITYTTAIYIGLFQVLSIIPGTSRAGATIIGALIIGVSRTAAAEFTFFMAVPVMFGYSMLKILKFGINFGWSFTSNEITTLIVGIAIAFAVSCFAINFLMNYIKKRDFKAFGIYRIILGSIIIALCLTPVL